MECASTAGDCPLPPERVGQEGAAQSVWEAGPADTLTSDSGLPSCDTKCLVSSPLVCGTLLRQRQRKPIC